MIYENTTYLDRNKIQKGETYSIYCDELFFNTYGDLFTFTSECYFSTVKLYRNIVKCTSIRRWESTRTNEVGYEYTFIDICDKNNILLVSSNYYYDFFANIGFWAVRNY